MLRKGHTRRGTHAGGAHVKKHASTLIEERRHRARKRHVAIGIGLAAAVCCIAIAVGVYAFFVSSDAKLDLAPSNAPESLAPAREGEPLYLFCVADIGTYESAPASYRESENGIAYLLVRLDEQARSLVFATIPSDASVRFPDGTYRPLHAAPEEGGDALLVDLVSDLCDVQVNHFAHTTAAGIAQMTDLLGGVAMDVPEEVDDPHAGIYVLPKGEQTLSGAQALVLLRAQNLAGGAEAAADARVAFTLALVSAALGSEGLDYANLVGEVGDHMNTDLTAADLLALGDAVRPMDTMTVYRCIYPGYDSTDQDTGESIYVCDGDAWEQMLARIEAGEDPAAPDSDVQAVNPADVKVDVRNGTQMVGAASQMAQMLEGHGYQVESVGNTDDNTIYPETLVVYTDPAYEGAAKAVARDLGQGRVVNGGDFYHSESNVISIVGADWSPVM